MRALFFYLIIIPLAILMIVLGATNRGPVTLVLDPFSPSDPALAIVVPAYILVFGCVIFGIIIGGAADWIRQGRFRKAARQNQAEAARWQREAIALKSTAEKSSPTSSSRALGAPGSI